MDTEKPCVICGKTMIRKSLKGNFSKKLFSKRKTCSTGCRAIQYSKDYILGVTKTRKKLGLVKCGYCTKEFEQITISRIYCSQSCSTKDQNNKSENAKKACITKKEKYGDNLYIQVAKKNSLNYWKNCGYTKPSDEYKMEMYRVRNSSLYRKFRESIKERDNYTCVLCGATENLCVDHIIPFVIDKTKWFEKDNLRTLCKLCHRQTDSYGIKMRNYKNNK